MSKLQGAVLALSAVVCVARAVAADDDPPRKKLDAAMAAYTKKQTGADKELSALLDKKEAAARRRGDKKVIDQMKAERDAFTKKGELPSWTPLDHIANRLASRAATVAAFDSAVKEYTKSAADEKAAAVQKERSAFDAKSNMVFCFEHEIRDKRGRVAAKHVIKLYSNMTCESSDTGVTVGKSTWTLKRDELEVRWACPGAPNGLEVDQMRIARDGAGYSGANVNGKVTVHGKRINPPHK